MEQALQPAAPRRPIERQVARADARPSAAQILPFPQPPASDLAALVRTVRVWNGPTALATLASVFAAVPLADEKPMSATDIHARVAAWSPNCIRQTLRDLVRAGLAERSIGERTHPTATPPNLYRRTARGPRA